MHGEPRHVRVDILIEEIGLCEEGAAHFEDACLAPRDLSRGTLRHDRTLLAGPHAFSEKVQNGKSVDHPFASDEDLVDLDGALDDASAPSSSRAHGR